MDEFRKKFEYEEHKGVSGLILVFFAMIVLFEYALGLIIMLADYTAVDIPEIARIAMKAGGLLYLALTVFISIALFKLPQIAVSSVKLHLAFRLLCLLPPVLYNYVYSLRNPEMTPSKLGAAGVAATTFQCLVLPVVYVVLFSVLWFIYFSRSKHVKEIYSNETKAFRENY